MWLGWGDDFLQERSLALERCGRSWAEVRQQNSELIVHIDRK